MLAQNLKNPWPAFKRWHNSFLVSGTALVAGGASVLIFGSKPQQKPRPARRFALDATGSELVERSASQPRVDVVVFPRTTVRS